MPAPTPQKTVPHFPILALFRIVIFAASGLVPGKIRKKWRRAWLKDLKHYTVMPRQRGLKRRYIQARIWHHFTGSMRDSWRLFCGRPAIRWIHRASRTPAFCLTIISAGLLVTIAASGGLRITRALLAPPYRDGKELVLVSEGGIVVGTRHAVSPEQLAFWSANNKSFQGLAGYQWDSHGTAYVTPDFFSVLGTRPGSFLLHPVRDWKPAGPDQALAVVGRLKPGISPAQAQDDLRALTSRYHHDQPYAATEQAQVMWLVGRTRKPFWAYAIVCSVATLLLLLATAIGMRTDRRRIGRIRGWYWAYFCAKSILMPLTLLLVIWEFSRATSFSVFGGSTFVAQPIFVWLVILACGGIVWWCLLDQWARCRACLRILEYPVRIGSLGAVLFDHAGTELMCRDGHGALYVPAVSSDYVQRGGWTAIDLEEIMKR